MSYGRNPYVAGWSLYPGGPPRQSTAALGDLTDWIDPLGISNIPGEIASALDNQTNALIDAKTQRAVTAAGAAASPLLDDAQKRAQSLMAGGVAGARGVVAAAEASANRVLAEVASAAKTVAIGTAVVGAVGVGAWWFLRRSR